MREKCGNRKKGGGDIVIVRSETVAILRRLLHCARNDETESRQ